MADVSPAFALKGRMLTFTVLHVQTTDLNSLEDQLAARVAQAPGMFNGTPVIVDLAEVADTGAALGLAALVNILRDHGLVPVAVRGGNPIHHGAAIAQNVGVLPDAPANTAAPEPPEPAVEISEPVTAEPEAAATEVADEPAPVDEPAEAEPPAPERAATMVIKQPVRSGQQIYARGGDLMVLASVSQGAEILADGHIHVYGTLRGRALAGATGNEEARLYCHNLKAELVSVAGNYRLHDDMDTQCLGKPAQVYLDGKHLVVETL